MGEKTLLLPGNTAVSSESPRHWVAKIRKKWRIWKEEFSYKIVILVFVFVLTGTANRVSFKIMTNSTIFRIDEGGTPVSYYSAFLTQFTTLVFVPIAWVAVFYLNIYTDYITPEMRKFPVWKYIVMGLLDALSGILMVCGGAGTSGTFQLLLIQGTIPFTMLFSFFMTIPIISSWIGTRLDLRYRWTHILGALVIFGTVIGAILPIALKGKTKELNPSYAIMFSVSVIPIALSSVYKELAFKGINLNIYLVCAWVSTFQFLLGFLTLPLSVLSEPNPISSLKHIPSDLYEGALCFLGYNTLGSNLPNLCSQRLVWLHVIVYIVFNILYNVSLLLLIKHGSASLCQLASTIMLPFTNICFTLGFIMNEFSPLPSQLIPSNIPNHDYNNYTNSFSSSNIVLFVLIILGLCLYRFYPEITSEKELSLDVAPPEHNF